MNATSIVLALTVLLSGTVGFLALLGLLYGLIVAADTRDVPDGNEEWL